MATRLQDAKIRVTLETDDARQRIDQLLEKEKGLEEAQKRDDRTREDRERDDRAGRGAAPAQGAPPADDAGTIRGTLDAAKRGLGTFLAATKFATNMVEPVLTGGVSGALGLLPDFLVSEATKRGIVEDARRELAAASAEVFDKVAKLESLIPAAQDAANIIQGAVAAGGSPTLQEGTALWEGLRTIIEKKAEVRAAADRVFTRELSGALPEAALKAFGMRASQ